MHENQQPQTEAFELSAAEREAIEHEMHHYEDPRAASIEALKIVQKQRGWVPDGAIYAIAKVLGIPASDVEGVATFYSQIFRQRGLSYQRLSGYSGGAREKAEHQTRANDI